MEKEQLVDEVLGLQEAFRGLQQEAEDLQAVNRELELQFEASMDYVRQSLAALSRKNPELLSRLQMKESFERDA
jgi:hypothetical protein